MRGLTEFLAYLSRILVVFCNGHTEDWAGIDNLSRNCGLKIFWPLRLIEINTWSCTPKQTGSCFRLQRTGVTCLEQPYSQGIRKEEMHLGLVRGNPPGTSKGKSLSEEILSFPKLWPFTCISITCSSHTSHTLTHKTRPYIWNIWLVMSFEF